MSLLHGDRNESFRAPFSVSPSQWRTEEVIWGVHPPPTPKFRSFEKAEPNSQFRGKYIHYNLIRIRFSLIYILSRTPN
jgi:hypothetical protein